MSEEETQSEGLGRWEHDVKHLTKDTIMRVIKCDDWQEFRLSLKGKRTAVKLLWLDWWLVGGCSHCSDEDRQAQVDNYINALKRGGQLDLEGNIVR